MVSNSEINGVQKYIKQFFFFFLSYFPFILWCAYIGIVGEVFFLVQFLSLYLCSCHQINSSIISNNAVLRKINLKNAHLCTIHEPVEFWKYTNKWLFLLCINLSDFYTTFFHKVFKNGIIHKFIFFIFKLLPYNINILLNHVGGFVITVVELGGYWINSVS